MTKTNLSVALFSWIVVCTCCQLLSTAQEKNSNPVDKYALPKTDEELEGSGPFRRADWFQDVWRERRQIFDKQKPNQKHTLVFLGDSITQGWGDDFHGVFGSKIANRGISGDTTRGMLHRLREDVLDLQPEGIVMLMGTNDLEEMAEPKIIAKNIGLIIDRVHQNNSKTPIILCLVFPSSESKKRPADKIRELNQLISDSVRGNEQVTLVDTWTLFTNAAGDASESEFPDLLHLNEVGYRKWEQAIRPILEAFEFVNPPEQPTVKDEGFVSLFNGRDLTGWGFRPTSEADRKSRDNWHKSDPKAAAWPIIDKAIDFPGQLSSSDGRYLAHHNRLIVRTPSEGRRIQQLWTTREFPNDFILRLEFRATPNADSGIFLRGNQLQCRDYLLAGPYKNLKQYKPQEWNEIEVTVRGKTARCTCNGEVLEEAMMLPATGPIGLEGDRGQMEYRNIRVRELNSKE